MSKQSPYTMTIGEDGLSVHVELDVHYITDEQLETVREHVETLERMNVLLREENGRLQIENDKLRELVRDVVLLAGCEGCDVTKMQLHVQGGDWRTVWERMTELGVPGTEVDHD